MCLYNNYLVKYFSNILVNNSVNYLVNYYVKKQLDYFCEFIILRSMILASTIEPWRVKRFRIKTKAFTNAYQVKYS